MIEGSNEPNRKNKEQSKPPTKPTDMGAGAGADSSHIVLTPQQTAIIEAISSRTCNVVVNAVAGASKTFTSLNSCARMPPTTSVMILTFNSRLKSETRTKVRKMNMSHRVNVHTYHSACVRHYDALNGKDDVGMANVVRKGPECLPHTPLCFDVLIIDECQDMTELYYRFVRKMMTDNARPHVTVAVFGDMRQCIYRFKDAEPRLFRLMPHLVPGATLPWHRFSLSTSFRVTRSMCDFVNAHLPSSTEDSSVGDVFMRSHKTTEACRPVRYVVTSNMYQAPLDEIMTELRSGNTRAGDIFVLAPSLHTGQLKKHVNALENKLVAMNIPCFVPTSRTMSSGGDESLMRGKVVFSTFHQSKGLERPVVLVMGFDANSCAMYLKSESCPSELYVACTRATRTLILMHGASEPPLPFMKGLQTSEYLEVVVPDRSEDRVSVFSLIPKDNADKPIDIHALLRFKSSSMLMKAAETMKMTTTTVNDSRPRHDLLLPQKAGKEFVADLHVDIVLAGLMVAQHVFRMDPWVSTTTNDAPNKPEKRRGPPYLTKGISERVATLVSKTMLLPDSEHPTLSIEDIAYMCLLADTQKHGYIHRLTQLQNWTWLVRGDTISKMTDLVNATCCEGRPIDYMKTITCERTKLIACPHVVNHETKKVWLMTVSEPTLDTSIFAAFQACAVNPDYDAMVICVATGATYHVRHDGSIDDAVAIMKAVDPVPKDPEDDKTFVRRILGCLG